MTRSIRSTLRVPFWHLIVEALVFGVVDGFFNPAIMAITPDLVDKDDLTSANSLNSISSNLAQLRGPLLEPGTVAGTIAGRSPYRSGRSDRYLCGQWCELLYLCRVSHLGQYP